MYENSKPGTQIIHENRPYAFEAYNETWPDRFEELAAEVRNILGEEVVDIEHVGSTSVPGMYAKPQIDILVTVKDLATIPSFYEPMQSHAYAARGDYTNEGEEYFTKDDATGTRLASIHILPVDHHWAQELTDLRDYLRSHPEEVAYYSAKKRKANEEFPNDYTQYYITKDPVIKELKQRAAKWRADTTE